MHGNMSMEKNEWKVAEDETIIVDPSDRPKVTKYLKLWNRTWLAFLYFTEQVGKTLHLILCVQLYRATNKVVVN